MDEIEIEENRLDFLKTQAEKRIGEILEENEGLKAKEKHVQTVPAMKGKPRALKSKQSSTAG